MGQKAKFVILGLIGILIGSLFMNLQMYSVKQSAEKESEKFRKENDLLNKKSEDVSRASRRMEEKINSLNEDLEKLSKEKEEVARKYDLVLKEKEELINKLSTRSSVETVRPSTPPVFLSSALPPKLSDDSYWAELLKTKTDLELQLKNLKEELGNVRINNEELNRQKNLLDLDISNLKRENTDLERQLEYKQKILDGVSRDLVNERNDKFQISNDLKVFKNENDLFRRQLKSLNNRKISLEEKLAALQSEKSIVENKLMEMDTMLKDYLFQIDKLNMADLDQSQTAIVSVANIPRGESVELPPIVVRPKTEAYSAGIVSKTGSIIKVYKDHNFVIIDLGENAGVKVGDVFEVYRGSKFIGSIEVIRAHNDIAACDIKKEIIPIVLGDTIR